MADCQEDLMMNDTKKVLDYHTAEAVQPGDPIFEEAAKKAMEPMTPEEKELVFFHGRD